MNPIQRAETLWRGVLIQAAMEHDGSTDEVES